METMTEEARAESEISCMRCLAAASSAGAENNVVAATADKRRDIASLCFFICLLMFVEEIDDNAIRSSVADDV